MALVPPAPDGASSEPTIGIKIKTLDGGNGFTLDVAANISVRDLKAKLQSQTGLVPTMQRIIFRGKMLQENALLSDYDVEDGHALHLVARPVIPPSPIVAPRPASPDAEPPPIHQLAWSEAQRRMLVNAALSSSRLNALNALRNNTRQERPTESAEHIRQGLMTVNTLLSRGNAMIPPIELQFKQPARTPEATPNSASSAASASASAAPCTSSNVPATHHHSHSAPTSPAAERTSKFYVGQWIDVKDTVNQWLEATVMEISETQIFVHYNGWPNRWDEWIDKNSNRVAAFRSVTLHSPLSPYLSPTPVSRLENPPNTGSEDLHKVTSDVCNMMQAALPMMQKIQALCKASMDRAGARRGETERTPRELAEWEELCTTARQTAPLFDRLGRLMADTAPFLSKFDSSRSDNAAGPNSAVVDNTRRSSTAPEREPQQYNLGPGNTPTTDPYNWLIGTSNNPPRTRPNNIDIHIHAILAPQQRSATPPPAQSSSTPHTLPAAASASSSSLASFTSPIRARAALGARSGTERNGTATQTSTLDALERLIRSTARSPHDNGTPNNNSTTTSATENSASASASAAATATPSPTSPMISPTEPGSTTDDSDDDSDDSNTNEVPLQNDDDRPSPCSQQLD